MFRFDLLDLARQLSAESADGGRVPSSPHTQTLCPITGNLTWAIVQGRRVQFTKGGWYALEAAHVRFKLSMALCLRFERRS